LLHVHREPHSQNAKDAFPANDLVSLDEHIVEYRMPGKLLLCIKVMTDNFLDKKITLPGYNAV
jgi:hypothetical protein